MEPASKQEPIKTPDLAKVREIESLGLDKIHSDPTERKYILDWKVFCAANPDQITIEMVTNVIKGNEYRHRNDVNKHLLTDPNNEITAWYYDMWSASDDALKGISDKNFGSKTIDYLKERAISWRNAAKDNSETLEKGGPFRKNPFEEIPHLEHQIEIWEHIASNFDAATRLFENAPTINFSLK